MKVDEGQKEPLLLNPRWSEAVGVASTESAAAAAAQVSKGEGEGEKKKMPDLISFWFHACASPASADRALWRGEVKGEPDRTC